jgi:acyl-coenzyme A thioesterase PaaI-like protein
MREAQGGAIVEKQPNSRMCFVCGIDNPIGLHLSFYTDEEGRCIARFRPKPEHQGYPGHLHGGIISTLLDETMGRVLIHRDVWAMTGRLEIKFSKPVPLDQELTIVGELTRSRSRAYEARGRSDCPTTRCWSRATVSSSASPTIGSRRLSQRWTSGKSCQTDRQCLDE